MTLKAAHSPLSKSIFESTDSYDLRFMVKILLSTRNQSKKQYYIHNNKKKNDGCLFGNDGDDNNMKTFKS